MYDVYEQKQLTIHFWQDSFLSFSIQVSMFYYNVSDNFPSVYDNTNGDLSTAQFPVYSNVLKVNSSFSGSAYVSKEISDKADDTGSENKSTETKADSKATKAGSTVTEATANGRAKNESTGNKTDLSGADNPVFVTE